MRPALNPTGHRVPRTKPTCLLHTWRPHQQRPFALVLHLHQHESSRNLHLQYLAKNQYTQHCQSLITQGSDHPPVLEAHMVLNNTNANDHTTIEKASKASSEYHTMEALCGGPGHTGTVGCRAATYSTSSGTKSGSSSEKQLVKQG
jgi:hypothetical protein